jgi:hypothetical protein
VSFLTPLDPEEKTPPKREAWAEQLEAAARAEMWRRGELTSWKLEPHQREVWDGFVAWNARRQTPEYALACELNGAELDDVWVEMLARRFGKTAKWIIGATQICLKNPGYIGTYATAFQKDIAEIIVPLCNLLLSDGPDSHRPKYQGTKQGSHEGLFFPNGSIIRLVGIDEHPDALRGRFSDFFVISEAAYVKGLEETVRSVILPQFQRRPHAFLALESSAPRQPGHDFMRVFVPDAKIRGAFVERTIEANRAISDKDRAKYIRQSGGRGHPTCEREYFNIIKLDGEQAVVPEFDRARHVVSRATLGPPPEHFRAYVGADPGSRDLFGLVFGYWDFLNARLVIQRSWAARNAPTRRVAAVTAAYEYLLWGKQPHRKMSDLPASAGGWRDLLAGVPELVELSDRLHAAANSDDRQPTKWSTAPKNATYWDGQYFRPNPCYRTSDTDIRMIQDISIEYGILFSPAAKDDAEAQRNALRDAIGAGRVVFLEDAGPVIDHVQNAEWNEKRTDYERHPVYGHYDCLAALIYMYRIVSRNANPMPPSWAGEVRTPEVATHRWHQDRNRAAEGVEALAQHLAGRQWR